MYNAIAYGLSLDDSEFEFNADRVQSLRNSTELQLRHNEKKYTPSGDEGQAAYNQSVDDVSKMTKWGDEIALHALADAYGYVARCLHAYYLQPIACDNLTN